MEFLYNRARRNRGLLQCRRMRASKLRCGQVRFKGTHMCNETKVNTNIGDVASLGSKKVLPPQYIGWIETQFGDHFIKRGVALDHAQMRSRQLAGMLALMYGEGLERFRTLPQGTQSSLMWMAIQLAEETETMFDIVVEDDRKVGA